MNKINVIGTSGSGKSTFAKALSKKLDYPHIEMDAVFWGKDWYQPNDDEFFGNLSKALKPDQWVLDGNYTRTIPIKWQDVDTIIWIDYSFPRTLYQAVKRAITRIVKQTELWPGTGNKESLKKLFTKDSIVLWTLKTYRKNRQNYTKISASPEYQHIEFVRLRSPKECQRFLNSLN